MTKVKRDAAGKFVGPSLTELNNVLNELYTIVPGSGMIHDLNGHRADMRAAISMYNKPGREKLIADTYTEANKFIIKIRQMRRG